jgi:DNA-3-methyladenine glycosylase II
VSRKLRVGERHARAPADLAEVTVRQTGTPDAPRLAVSAMIDAQVDTAAARAELTTTLVRLLGLEVDIDEFYALAARDPDLGPLADRFRGLKPPRFPTMFECVANAIACQQLTLTVGITLLNRLADSHGPVARNPPVTTGHAFPDPGDLVLGTTAGLRAMGFSTRKATALLEIARHIDSGELALESLQNVNNDDASDSLQHLGGVGRWSAEYALLRGLGRLDGFPGDDVGARNNLARRLGLAAPLDYAGVQQAVARWAPFAGLAYFHLLLERIDEAGWL